jgi:D-serine dehydratase
LQGQNDDFEDFYTQVHLGKKKKKIDPQMHYFEKENSLNLVLPA